MKKLVIFLVILGAVVWYSVHALNVAVQLDETCTARWSQVLNQYERRADLIPNLVATVKGYAVHEEETLTGVVEARAKATQTTVSSDVMQNPQAMQAFMDNQGALSSALSRLMVVVEKYPDLKADKNFLSLQSQLEGTENRLSVAKRDYIEAVRVFNSRIRTIPTKWIVSHFSDMQVKPAFEIEEAKKSVPVVDFAR